MVTSAEPGIVMTPVMEMSLAFVQRTAFSRSEEPMPMIEVPTTWAVDGTVQIVRINGAPRQPAIAVGQSARSLVV